jgi:oxygen-independent coproporphyrinogen-3 oxidase
VASVYVHAPFCARRCFYCDFAVQVRRGGDLSGWIRALEEELRALEREGTFRLADRLRTLYVGGGTPSLLGPEAMEGLARALGRRRLEGGGLEWTAEANPESFTPRVAEAWRRAGVGRISLGVQSFQESALRWMGRLHGPEGALDAVETARRAGFGEIGVDLIFGLPARLGRDWSADLERVLDLDVTHVSLYGLTVEEGTPLGRSVAAGRERVADEARYREAYLEAAERLSAGGYVHYEVSNLARPGSESAHNRVYWDGGAYVGLGNSAHSYRHPLRRWNLASWDAYREEVERARPPVAGSEILDAAAERLERLWLGLRTRRGLATGGAGGSVEGLLRSWARAGLAEVAEDVVRLTAEGWLVMDRLVVELDDALEATRPVEATGPVA